MFARHEESPENSMFSESWYNLSVCSGRTIVDMRHTDEPDYRLFAGCIFYLNAH
jgi:hypothetical protein